MTGDAVVKEEKEIVLRDYLGYEKKFKNLNDAVKYVLDQIEQWFSFEHIDLIAGGTKVMHRPVLTYGAAANVSFQSEELSLAIVYDHLLDGRNAILKETFRVSEVKQKNQISDTREQLIELTIATFSVLLDYYQSHAIEYRRIDESHDLKLANIFVSLLVLDNKKPEAELDLRERVRLTSLFIKNYLSDIHDLIENTRGITVLQAQAANDALEDASKLASETEKLLQEKVNSLEQSFTEQLRLKKPVERWAESAKAYNFWSIVLSVAVVLVSMVGLCFGYNLIRTLPESAKGIFSLQSFRSAALLFFLSAAYFYLVRILARLLFSSLHLARDAKEREYLTHVYLALIIEGGVVDESSRELVLQALFSRSNTGLLGDDSSPTMPSVGDVSRAVSAVSRLKS